MRLRLYFLRHGQTTASRDDLFCGLRSNHSLTSFGIEMANLFASAYANLNWAGIYCSPQKRALETAQPISSNAKIKPAVREGLSEIDYGKWDGKNKEEVEAAFHDDFLKWNADPAWNAPTGGETAIAVSRRARIVLEEIITNHTEGNVLIVSHKATIRIMLCDLLGIDLSRFRDRLACPVASVSLVEFGLRGPILLDLADRDHMPAQLRELGGT
jgi:broad specificity phosphatase PhoE